MKGILLASLALSLLLVSNTVLARDVAMDLRLTQDNPTVGDEVLVTVNLDQVSDLKGLDILISFDNVKLEYKSAEKGQSITSLEGDNRFVEDIVTDPEAANKDGKIEYMSVRQKSGLGISWPGGIILTLNFIARSPGEAWIKLDANDVPLGDSMANLIATGIDEERQIIEIGQTFRLQQVFSYPNPAPDPAGNATIRVKALALLEDLEASIYDISGELVLEIAYEDFDVRDAPVYEYVWDCKNEAGDDVANGIYILWIKASLESEKKHETWKIAILR